MKIQRLELFGFKSFREKTVITFDQAITGIIGSNGCGKSNVVDALYWVMGDMSPKHLRGSSMTDVIFSGSRDVAALDLAEVTLVLTRDPSVDVELPPHFNVSSEIQITRRYYRSGESEYFINKVACRLRDIQEFFMDTGVGAKAYSIVEQGAIARMISLKPEDRRVVIEEVAGIMKFKARKAETERKIEYSLANLQRVDDIVQDLQKQMTALKRQADKAEKFKLLSEQLRSLELRLASKEWVERSQVKSSSLAECSALRQQLAELEIKVQSESALLDQATSDLSDLEQELSSRRDQTRFMELALKDLESENKTLLTRTDTLTLRKESDERSIEEISTRVSEAQVELGDLGHKLSEASATVERLFKDVEAADLELSQRSLQLESLRSALQESRKVLHQEDIHQTKITHQIQSFQRNLAQLEGKKTQLSDQLELVESENVIRTAERDSTLKNLDAAFATRSELESEKLGVDQGLAQLEQRRAEFIAKRDNIKNDFTRVRIRKEQLQALERDLDGVDAAAKSLALHFREQGQTRNLLADIISVPAVLERAVESVLGRSLQRVIAQDLSQVDELRNLIVASEDSSTRQGRLPLWINSRSASSAVSDLNGVYLQTARTVEIPGPDGLFVTQNEVVTLSKYLATLDSVLGPLDVLVKPETGELPQWLGLLSGFYVVRDRAAITAIAEKVDFLPVNLVSLDGDILYSNGFFDLAPVEAATDEATSGLIQRKRVITDLSAQEEALQITFNQAQAQLDECIFLENQSKEKFRELTHRLTALNPDVERHSVFLRQVEAQLARLLEKKENLLSQQSQVAVESIELSERLAEITLEFGVSENRKQNSLATVHAQETEIGALQELHSARLTYLNDLRSELRSSERSLSELQSRRAGLEQECSILTARKGQLDEEILSLAEQIGQIRTQLEDCALRLSVRAAELNQSRDLEAELAATFSLAKATLKGRQQILEQLNKEHLSLSNRFRDLDQTATIQDVELRNLSEKIETQYQIALATLSSEQLADLSTEVDIEEMADPDAGKRHMQQLRQKMENLGRINMVAVEEFDDVRKRHEYLFIQREDLSDGLRQLRDAIDRIDRESRERFSEAFHAVNAAFQATFPLLFGGGNAELRLTVPDNMLETGVEIIAQPPGKKLQSVTLLSGGEKALTAVSLIFGIFSIKPSPFCVLDEVDAPLDDANVGRFNNLVRTITGKSQVIMITHHKKTMESADALFGVTMEQPGISKLASVKLGELQSKDFEIKA